MKDDSELLQRFAEEGDQAAFRELVDRHVALVYSSAIRQLNGDAHLAADVAQMVFTDLARKARSLGGHRVLAGWLFTSTRFAAAKLVRTEQRRRAREQEAHTMDELCNDPAGSLEWGRVRPVLDAALAELSEADREAILLRYFEHRDYREIGGRLSVGDNTARMRVERALDKLRVALERRGVTSTGVALAAALAGEAVAAAPAGLAAHVAGAAIAAGGSVGWLATLMSMTKLQVGIAGALAAAAGTGYVVEARTNAALRSETAAMQTQTAELPALRQENIRLGRKAAEVAMLRGDTDEFAAMSNEAADLKRRLEVIAQIHSRQMAEQAAARQTAAYDLRTLDMLPAPRVRTPPKYPADLRAAGVRGEATVDFIVDKNGDVQNAQALKATNPEFGQAAVDAVAQWKFKPGLKGGREVNTHMQVPIVFALPTGANAADMNVTNTDAQPVPVPVPARTP